MVPRRPLDAIDCRILAALQEDGRMSNLDLSEKVGLSPSPCSRRVHLLESEGFIRHYVALLDPATIDLPVHVFVNITLEKQIEASLQTFERTVLERPEVLECYLMTGSFDYLLRVVVSDLAAYERFVLDHLTRIPGVASIKSSFALKQVQYRTALPLGHLTK
jgi:DNA-binding Lrp family transcriptional regulator